ncbi:prophage regulatory protein [Mycobacterium intracellulare subsp. yongonense 05-1390]|uniref:helix-turn-helix domain-containing protein n=1 Tax=Mycobacterium TaxID=1763 RepID=UPI00025D575B|nr:MULTISPECIES: helix-turn-helix transcriptional regulator [Mycobacterium]AFJ35076.1 prophage regulatory protein [Mycobacterium sp. MOTT36Y]AGP63561.1 prophage regulatory protein [Mycobacterium intracellulare subsp. yongonense 05-1390]ELR84819.1 prophage regulatory protein [Mycobacterium sp. H4Y]PBA55299.1 XRE family transcriptional regulator [Mycobacterium intracellulare subsp. chimaera]
MSDDQEVGANIRRFRQARGLPQAALGEPLGLNQQAIAKIENGTRAVKLAEAAVIARTLGVELDDIAAGPERTSRRAAFTRLTTTLRGLDEELTYLAERLSEALVELANELGGHLGAPVELRVPLEIAREADELLIRRWGHDLDDLLRELVTTHAPGHAEDYQDYVDALHAIVESAADTGYPGIDSPGKVDDDPET